MTTIGVVKLIITIVQLVASVFLIAVVLLQSGKSAGLSGAIAGGADALMSRTKAKGWDAKLARWTKYVAIIWIILTLILTLM
jgi:preprotein translocase subunit SecG